MIRKVFALGLILLPRLVPGQSFTISTVAGAPHFKEGASAISISMRRPQGMAADGAGGYYLSDYDDGRVFQVKANGTMTLIAGGGTAKGSGGLAKDAALVTPSGLALDKSGNLYVAEYLNNVIRKIALNSGIISTIAGNGRVTRSGDNGPATQAGMDPQSIAISPTGQYLYIADQTNNVIRRIDLATNIISTIAGTGGRNPSGEGAIAIETTIVAPSGISVDSAGNIAFVEVTRIRQLKASTGTIVALAGLTFAAFGTEEIAATLSGIPFPQTTAFDPSDNLLIGSSYDVRMVSAVTGRVSKLAGGQAFGYKDGAANQSLLVGVHGVLALGTNNVLFADDNHRIGRIASALVSTVAGGDVKDGGPALSGFLDMPEGVASDTKGNIYIADRDNSRVRKVSASGTITTVIDRALAVAGPQNVGLVAFPRGVSVDDVGNAYISDTGGDRLYRLEGSPTPRLIAGGNGTGFSGDGGQATSAKLAGPSGIATDNKGNVYFADYDNFRIRRVDGVTGVITTVAGNGKVGYSGDGGPATAAGCDCRAVALDRSGNLFIADYANDRIRRVDALSGVITTVAGNGVRGYLGDGGLATQASLDRPTSVALDGAGILYIADWGNYVVRMVTASGIMRTIAGAGDYQPTVESGAARLVNIDPRWVWAASDGSLLVTDQLNHRIRRLVTQKPAVMSISQGDGQTGSAGSKIRIAVKVIDADGLPVANAVVSVSISGTGTIPGSSMVTGADGVASGDVTLGNVVGPVTVVASLSGVNSVTIRLTITAPPVTSNAPRISPGGIVGAGLSIPAVRALAPLGLATIFGERFALPGTVRRVTGADLVNGQVPTSFAGVCVTVDNVRAPIASVTDAQISFQAPLLIAGTQVEVRVATGCDTATEAISDPERIGVQAAAPEFYSFVLTNDGKNPIAAVDAITAGYVGRSGLITGAAFRPAQIGQPILLFANNFGETTTNLQAGAIPQGLNPTKGLVSLTIGGRPVPPQEIQYAGVAPFNPGLYQINLTLGAGTPTGDQPVVVTVAGVASTGGSYLTIADTAP